MSDNIFKELCNRVLSLFKQTETNKENAKDVACNRLRVVLMQDRTNLTPELLQRMRRELVELLSKYVEMDKDALELNFDQEGDQMALMLSIPVIRAKDEAEIEAALKEEDTSADNNDEEDKSEEDKDDDENSDNEEPSEANDEEPQNENNENSSENNDNLEDNNSETKNDDMNSNENENENENKDEYHQEEHYN